MLAHMFIEAWRCDPEISMCPHVAHLFSEDPPENSMCLQMVLEARRRNPHGGVETSTSLHEEIFAGDLLEGAALLVREGVVELSDVLDELLDELCGGTSRVSVIPSLHRVQDPPFKRQLHNRKFQIPKCKTHSRHACPFLRGPSFFLRFPRF